MTQEVKITLVKPPGGVEIKESKSTTLLTGVELRGHSSFRGCLKSRSRGKKAL